MLARGLYIWKYILWELQIHLQATYTSQSSTDCLQSLMPKETSCQKLGSSTQTARGRGPGSRQEGSVPRRAAQQPSKTIKDHAPPRQKHGGRAVLIPKNAWSQRAFQIPRRDEDEDEKGAVPPKRKPEGDTTGCLGTGDSAQTWTWKTETQG